MSHAITDADFDAQVLKSQVPVVLDFWAPWCGPCRIMNPLMEELSAEYGDKVKFLKMNVDENIDTPGKFNVMSIPTFVMFKNGQPAKTLVGTKSKEDMKQEIDTLL